METFTRIPTRRQGMGVGVVDDRFIWTFGGFDGDKAVGVIEMCDIKNRRVEDIECEDDTST